MNSNKGMDPMLSSFTGDSIWNTKIITDLEVPFSQFLPLTSRDPGSPVISSIPNSPEIITGTSFADLASLWSSDRKRVASEKSEEDEGFSDVGSSQMDNEDDFIRGSISPLSDDVSMEDSCDEFDCQSVNTDSTDSFISTDNRDLIISSEKEARRYVDEEFLKIASLPKFGATHKDKIEFILSLSDCKDYSIEQIMSLDKKNPESARICSKIVENIPHRYRWECVTPEQIPNCYTIVADCKKSCSRDKPPRPMNAFMIWAQGARRLINELCPKMQNAAISEALGFCWRHKTESFKQKFEMEKIKLRRFHNFEFPEYKYKPKTKIQKAKEKEELSLSKAKLSKTAAKRKRTCDTEPKETSARKGKCGRPKKAKTTPAVPQPKIYNSNSKSRNQQKNYATNVSVNMPATNPAIKDMLSLKIMNDRRSKELGAANSPPPHPRENVQHFLGQLSPLDVTSPASSSSGIFEDLETVSDTYPLYASNEQSPRVLSSSVFDTPSSTPPVDTSDMTRLSPVQHQRALDNTVAFVSKATTSSSAFSSSVSSFSTSSTTHNSTVNQPRPKTNKTGTTNKCLLSPQASMPSLTAILSSGPHIPPRRTTAPLVSPRLPLTQRNNKTNNSINNTPNSFSPINHTRCQSRLSSADVFLSCVSEIIDFPEPKKPGDFLNRDNNNNNSTNCNDNNTISVSFFDNNNNTPFRSWDGFLNEWNSTGTGISGLLNPKLSGYSPSKIFDFNDLDTLCPDLTVPLLSDDVMSSLMNTL